MKITKYLVSMAAALGMIAGCYKPEMIQVSAPEDVVAPVLAAVEGPIEITADNMANGSVEFKWSLADYGVKTQVSYAIEVASASAKATLASGMTADTTAMQANELSTKIAYEALNQILFNDLELADGVATKVSFTVIASVGEYPAVRSNSIEVSCKVTAAEKVYPTLTVAGSYAYNSWTPGKGQFVFDFDGNDTKYSGMIDFGEDVSALNFKFVGSAWGENEFSVPSGEAQAPEAAELPLVAGGGDNIAAYTTHRFVSLTLDKATPKVIKNFSFNQIGVIGDFNGWGEDVVMQFNAAKQKFYADVDFSADGGFKFRADGAWDLNWGVKDGILEVNGDNIPVTAGKYRVYVNMNNPAEMTYELSAGAYNTEEGTPEPEPEPEPEPAVQGWGLVGEFNSWGGSADLMLTSDGNYLVAKGVSIEGQFKFRKDADWAVNFGATGDVEPFELTANVETELAAGGKNMVLPAGTFDIYFDEANAKAWFINDGSYPGGGAAPEASEWGVVGQVNSWGGSPDIVMYKTATEGLFVAKSVAMPDGGFKIRANNAWNDDANYGLATAGAVEVDHVYDVITGGGSGDMTLVAGTYDIWFDRTNEKVYIMTPGKAISEAVGGEAGDPAPAPEPEPVSEWYLVGGFNGWTAADAAYQMTKSGDWFVFENFTLAEDAEVKFVADANWSVNRGGAYAAGEAIALEQNGSNLAVPAGTYDVYLSADATTAYFMAPGEAPALPDTAANTWYLVGGFNGWTAGDAAYQMTYEAGWHVFKNFTLAEASEVKLNAGSWDVNRGGTFAAVGEAIAVEHNGANIAVPAGSYDVYLNKAEDTLYFMTPGATPAN